MNELLSTPGRRVIECIESWHNNDASLWYRIYSDGYVEQGGITSCKSTSSLYYIELPVEMMNTNYVALVEPNTTASYYNPGASACHFSAFKKESNRFQVYCNTETGLNPKAWYVCGFMKV